MLKKRSQIPLKAFSAIQINNSNEQALLDGEKRLNWKRKKLSKHIWRESATGKFTFGSFHTKSDKNYSQFVDFSFVDRDIVCWGFSAFFSSSIIGVTYLTSSFDWAITTIFTLRWNVHENG
jgi:hypothetical protein